MMPKEISKVILYVRFRSWHLQWPSAGTFRVGAGDVFSSPPMAFRAIRLISKIVARKSWFSAEISNRVNTKMCLRRDPSIAREKSINFDLFFHTWSDDRGPGPLSSDKILKNNFKFIDFSRPIEGSRRSCTSGAQICLTQSSCDSYNIIYILLSIIILLFIILKYWYMGRKE